MASPLRVYDWRSGGIGPRLHVVVRRALATGRTADSVMSSGLVAAMHVAVRRTVTTGMAADRDMMTLLNVTIRDIVAPVVMILLHAAI